MYSHRLLVIPVLVWASASAIAQTAYVTNYNSDEITVVNLATQTVTGQLLGCKEPVGVAVTASNAEVWVACSETNTIAVFSTSTNRLIATIPAGPSPWGMAIVRNLAFVANFGAPSVWVMNVNTRTTVKVLDATQGFVGSNAYMVVASPDGNSVYVGERSYNGNLMAIDVATLTIRRSVPLPNIFGVAVSPDSKTVFAADVTTGNISVLDALTLQVKNTIVTGIGNTWVPTGIAISLDGTKLYAGGYYQLADGIWDIATGTQFGTVQAGSYPWATYIWKINGKEYLASVNNGDRIFAPNSLTVTDLSTKAISIYTVGTYTGTSTFPLFAALQPPSTAAPTVVSLTPVNGTVSGTTTFTATVADTAGNADIGLVYLLFNSSLSVRYGCLLAYDNTNNFLLLFNDAGSGLVSGTLTPGAAGTLSNTRCTINGTGASVIHSGNNLVVAVPITFSGAFVGVNTEYVEVVTKGQQASGYVAEGTWTGNADPAPTIPTGQFSGTGNPQTFSFQFTDSTSGENIGLAYVIFGENLKLNNGCTVVYSAGLGVVYLLDDAGTGLAGFITPGVAGTAANGQCTIASGGTTSVVGPTLTVPLTITFAARFGGLKTAWGYALNAVGLNSGFVQIGTWSPTANVTPGTPTAPTPAGTGNGPYTFTLTYPDANGYLDLEDTYLLISSTGTGVNACEVVYAPAYNAAFLLNDAGTGFVAGIMTPGVGGTISNTHCSLTNAGAPSNNGTTNLTVPFQVTFASFTGTKTYYGQAIDASGAASAFQALGTVNLP